LKDRYPFRFQHERIGKNWNQSGWPVTGRIGQVLDDKNKAPEQRKAGIASAEARLQEGKPQFTLKDLSDESISATKSVAESQQKEPKKPKKYKKSKGYKEYEKVRYTEAEQTLERKVTKNFKPRLKEQRLMWSRR